MIIELTNPYKDEDNVRIVGNFTDKDGILFSKSNKCYVKLNDGCNTYRYLINGELKIHPNKISVIIGDEIVHYIIVADNKFSTEWLNQSVLYGDVDAMYCIGLYYEREKEYDKAINIWIKAVEKDYTRSDIIYSIAGLYKILGNIDQMEKYLKLGVDMNSLECSKFLAIHYIMNNDNENLEKLCKILHDPSIKYLINDPI